MRWLVVLSTLLWCVPAFAGVVLVPSPALVADGTTVSTVRFYVDDGARIKVKADSGKVGPAVAGNDGVVTVPFTPPAVTAARTIAFKVTAGGIDSTFDVAVVPPFAGALKLTFDPPQLASTGTALVRIEPSGSSPIATEGRRFSVVASAGTLEAVAPAGNGTWVARYTPPKALANPVAVVFTAADAAAPDRVYGNAVLPVTVKRPVTLDVKPGSTNVLVVGARTYGPLVAAPSGKVAFDVDLDPREPTGNLQSINPDTSKDERTVPLAPAAAQIAFLPMVASAPAQSDTAVPVRIVLYTATGTPRADATVHLSANVGTVSPVAYDKATGTYTATYTPPTTPGEALLTADVDGVKTDARVHLVGGLPTVSLASDPAELAKGATSFKVVARVKDAQGTGVLGQPPTLVADGATLAGPAKDNKDGSYTFTYKVSSTAASVRVYAAPPVSVSTMPAVRLLAWPGSATVAANGTDSVSITVVALDTFGLPVPNVELKLGAPKGDGGVPPAAKTDAHGMARVVFKAGTVVGLASVRVEGAGLSTEIPLFQAKGGPAPMLSSGGSVADEALASRWRAASPELRVLRAGVAPPSGPPATVQIATMPPYTTPGAAILVTVRVTDGSGVGVGAKKLAVQASPATVGPITDSRDGTYTFPLQLPAGQDGPVTIVIGAEGATGSVLLPTLAGMAAQAPGPTGGARSNTTGGARASATGGAGAPAQAMRAPASDAEWAKLRGGVGLLNSRGSYDMTSDGGAQLLGAADFATPSAGFWGFGGQAVWLPLQYAWGGLGLDARGRGQVEWFGVGGAQFIEFERDGILAARYRRALGGIFSVEGSLGAHYTTGVLFRYADAARSDAEVLNFPLFGARLGGLASLESERVYASVEFAETFAPYPIDTHAEGLFDYKVGDGPATVRVGAAWDYRTMKYAADGKGGDTGTAAVEQNQFTIQAGAGAVF